MLSTKQKRIIFQILPFGIVPALFSAVHVHLEKGILGNHPIYPSTGNPYDANIFISVFTSLIIGILIGLLEVFYVNPWFQHRSFYQKIVFKFLLYLLAIVLASATIVALGHAVSQNESPFSATVFNFVSSFFTNFAFWSIICYYSIAILISLFYKEVSDNMGHTVSLNFFTGIYHRPKSEFRVFMFLDMKSSTSHAEKLGHIRYFEMLKAYYDDLSHAILTYGGEIYQYVGDEIVITWKLKKDFAMKALDCFFAMQLDLNKKSKSYLSTYGFVPEFKAGLHVGKVITGEIGRLKKEIVFTGDTLNTTARIQSLCNQHKAELLASEDFIKEVASTNHYEFLPLGKVQLRGREQEIKLFNVKKQNVLT